MFGPENDEELPFTDTVEVQLPPNAELADACRVIEKLVVPMKVTGCGVTAAGLSLRHAETLAANDTFSLDARGQVNVPLDLPELIVRGEVREAGVFAKSCGLWFDEERTSFSMTEHGRRSNEPEAFYAWRAQLLRDKNVLTDDDAREIRSLLPVQFIRLKPGAWQALVLAPELFAGFHKALLTVRSRPEHVLELIRSFRARAFEPSSLRLELGPTEWGLLETISATLGGEFSVGWGEGEHTYEREFGLFRIDRIDLQMRWRRPRLQLTLSSTRSTRVVDFIAHHTGCPVALREKA
ncbi:MAG: hypothetical protein QM817_07270 [Archangium sp.]